MKLHIKRFIRNDSAVSEEFTALPALTVVMIGFTLFSVLIAQAYGAYIEREEKVDFFQESIDVLDALLLPNSPLFAKNGVVDSSVFFSNDSVRHAEVLTFLSPKMNGAIILSFNNTSVSLPSQWSCNTSNHVSVSKNVAVKLNEVETIPGVLSVVIWGQKS